MLYMAMGRPEEGGRGEREGQKGREKMGGRGREVGGNDEKGRKDGWRVGHGRKRKQELEKMEGKC